MQISKIQNTEGEGKQVMSKFPMKGHKANWFMLASGCKSTANWHVKVYQKKNIVEEEKKEEQAAEGEGQGG